MFSITNKKNPSSEYDIEPVQYIFYPPGYHVRHLHTLMLHIYLLLIHVSEQFPRGFSTTILHVFDIFTILATYTAHYNTTR